MQFAPEETPIRPKLSGRWDMRAGNSRISRSGPLLSVSAQESLWFAFALLPV